MSYKVFSQSVRGFGHIKKNTPCEDFGLKKETDICKIFALADGHGDNNCPRSNIGSKFICEICAEELENFANSVMEENWATKLFEGNETETIIRQLITSVFGKWICAVNEHYDANALSEDEISSASEYIEKYRNGEQIEHIYGTTLICGLLTNEYLLLLQQGDGRCVVFDCDGNVSQPIPWDDRCFANVTTSLCDNDAAQSCRYYIIDLKTNPIIACVAGTDGVEDSFSSMDKMHAYYRILLKFGYDNGINTLEDHLFESLPRLSENGSGDDTTVCGFVDIERIGKFLEKFNLENEIISVEDTVISADERIKSMSAKLEYLRRKYEVIDGRCSEAEDQYKIICEEYNTLISSDAVSVDEKNSLCDEDINSSDTNLIFSEETDGSEIKPIISKKISRKLQKQIDTVLKLKTETKELLSTAELQKKEIEDEYFPYKEKYESFLCLKKEAQKRLEDLKGIVKSAVNNEM